MGILPCPITLFSWQHFIHSILKVLLISSFCGFSVNLLVRSGGNNNKLVRFVPLLFVRIQCTVLKTPQPPGYPLPEAGSRRSSSGPHRLFHTPKALSISSYSSFSPELLPLLINNKPKKVHRHPIWIHAQSIPMVLNFTSPEFILPPHPLQRFTFIWICFLTKTALVRST